MKIRTRTRTQKRLGPLEKAIARQKAVVSRITRKYRSPTCSNFCKGEYLDALRRKLQSVGADVPKTEEDISFAINTCKKTFCNPKCEGYDFFGNKEKQGEFMKKIHKGFQKTFSQKQINTLKKKGVLSGCVHLDYI